MSVFGWFCSRGFCLFVRFWGVFDVGFLGRVIWVGVKRGNLWVRIRRRVVIGVCVLIVL